MNKRTRTIVNSMSALIEPVIAARGDLDRPVSKVPGLSVRASADGATADELMVYGAIGGGDWFNPGITASDIAGALKDLRAPRLNVRINSGGGDAFDGTAIYTMLCRHPAQVVTYIDGLAASAASVIAMAGDEIRISDAGMLMIHDASTMTYGNGAAHRSGADLLDKISDVIAGVYANRAGEDAAHWRALMSDASGDGTWYTGQEALDAGLVDEVERLEDPAEVSAHALGQAYAAHLRVPDPIVSVLRARAAAVSAGPITRAERLITEFALDNDTIIANPGDESSDHESEWAWLAQAARVRGQ